MTEPAQPEHQNRLAQETSPYLLQHAHNPVDWYPWGPEALERARREDRPILLSVGYSACHWCHVMERESFCDETTARLMNDNFVCIKVDREERPDLDEIYMAATIAMTGSGGWPMTVFLTPEQEPFFAGTYFPPDDVPGRPGFRNLLQQLAKLWKSQRSRLLKQAESLARAVRERARPAAPMTVGQDAIDRAVARLRESFDARHGGFGPAPRFPATLSLELLMRHHRRTGDPRALEMVTVTLDAMARGGMRDHLGGGFARYSTDERWLVPHFEKMLYDNASLARTYAAAYQLTGNDTYRTVVEETLSWVLRDMRSPAGGFYSATDADSEGEEGKYFVWTPAEVARVLPEHEARAFCAYYDVTPGGNWEHKSILHTPRSERDVAIEVGCSVAELRELLTAAREKMLAARAQRLPPLLDDKVLTSWNGLMIGALAECGRVLGEQRFIDAAARAADFVWKSMRRDDGRLWRTYRDGRARHSAVLEDYALLCDGLIDLYEAAGAPQLLQRAGELAARIISDFGDDQQGGFFATAADHEQLLVRFREGQDGALPGGNATAARALARLSFYRDDERLRRLAADAVSAHGRLIERAPEAFAGTLRAVDLLLEGPVEVVLVGSQAEPRGRELRREIARHYLPNLVLVHHDPEAASDVVAESLVRGRGRIDGGPAAYVCRSFVCRAPVTDPAELGAVLHGDRDEALAGRRSAIARTRSRGAASAEGTRRYAARHGAAEGDAGFGPLGRTGLVASRFGFGGYRIDERAPEHGEALRRALLGGCNLIDTSTNYTDGDSERLIGTVLRGLVSEGELARDEVIVVSKIGYVQGANLELAKARAERGEAFADMVRYVDDCWHNIHPSYLADQLDRSLDRLGLETVDVCLLHNPEYFLTDAKKRGERQLDALREQFYGRIERAFAFLEEQVRSGRIRYYGVSSNTLAAGADDPEATDPARMWAAAERACGSDHHFAVLQLPANLLEARAVLDPTVGPIDGSQPTTVLAYAQQQHLAVLVNRPLNAIVDDGLVRLADPPAESGERADLSESLDDLAELEQRFDLLIGHQLATGAGRSVGRLLSWSEQLRAVDGQLHSTEQLAQIAYGQVMPRTTRVLVAVDASLDQRSRSLFAGWQQEYLGVLERCFDALRAQIHQHMRERSRQLSVHLDPCFEPALRGEPLQRKALAMLASTPGVDVVLLGMRRPAYVDDALAVMSWPTCDGVEAVYAAVRDAR